MSSKAPTKDEAKSILRGILDLDLAACQVSVCLASVAGDDDVPTFQRLQISDDLIDDFREVAASVIQKRKNADDDGDLVLHPYDAGTNLASHEVEYVDLSQHSSIADQIASLSSLTGLAVFNVADDFVAGLRFYVIVVQPTGSEPIYCFRSYSPKKELGRSPVFAALFAKGQFDRVREPLFLFDQHIDCISRGGLMFIFSKDKFQKIFRFFEMVLNAAKVTLKKIRARVPISNFDEFEKACEGHLQKLAKLKNIADKPYLDKLTMADMKKVIKAHRLSVQTTGKGKNESLVFDPADKWAILHLLDDDYLDSLMTGQHYEAPGKRVHG